VNKPLTHYLHYSRFGTDVAHFGDTVNLPKLSIAARLYAIFALMGATTIALSVVAMTAARHNRH
jgi:hypothetical protein